MTTGQHVSSPVRDFLAHNLLIKPCDNLHYLFVYLLKRQQAELNIET